MLRRPLAVALLAPTSVLPVFPRNVGAQQDPSEAEISAEPTHVEEGVDYRVYDRSGRAVSLDAIVKVTTASQWLSPGWTPKQRLISRTIPP